jgi:hypothetical protein
MWSDNETELDAINVQHVVAAVLEILTSPHLTPITVGVFGPWGIGKSSVAKMIERVLTPPKGQEKDSQTLVVYFNGWRFEGYEDAKAALAAVILEALEQRVKLIPGLWEKSKTGFRDLWGRVNWLRVGKTALTTGLAVKTGGLSVLATHGAGLLAGSTDDGTDDGADDEGDEKEKDDAWLEKRARAERDVHATIRDFDKAFKRLLDLTEVTRLVVVIDDLDRCLPDRVIDTLEAIRLFLAVEGTAFVITADEVLVQHAVKARFPGMEALRAQVGQDYLEKMIQIPVRLPLLGRADLENYLNLLFAQRRLSKERFTGLCHRLVAPLTAVASPEAAPAASGAGTSAPGVDVPFSLDTAAELLDTFYSPELRDDLALAKQIVHVVGLSVAGNPRQVKRYLNALVLRLSIARKRGVVIDAPLAAKLMLLEYFRTEAFLQLARWQAVQRGRPQEIAALERARTGERVSGGRAEGGAPEGGAGAEDARASAVPVAGGGAPRRVAVPASRDGKATAATEATGAARGASHAAAPGPTAGGPDADAASDATGDSGGDQVVGPEAAAWLQDEWLRAWLDTTPRLAGTDLGPYFYFARDRFVAQAVSTQQLGPLGEAVLAGLMESSRAARLAVEARARGLTPPVAFAVLAALTERARLTGKPDTGDDSPYGAIYTLCEWRPEVAGEVVRFFGTQPLSAFRAATPPRLLAATAASPAAAAGRALVQQWSLQKGYASLATAAARALRPTAGTGAPAAATARPGA